MTDCDKCGMELAIDKIKMRELEVFCPNPDCEEFVKSFWIDR